MIGAPGETYSAWWHLTGPAPLGVLAARHRLPTAALGELAPVFDAMLANATRICGAEFGIFYLDDGDLTRIAAVYNVPPALAATQNAPFRVHPAATLRFAGPSRSYTSTISERCRHILNSDGPGRSPQRENRTGSNQIGKNPRSTSRWNDVPRGTMDEVSSRPLL